MTYTLHVVTWPGLDTFMVGEPGRDYMDCYRRCQLIVAALHGGELPHIRCTSIKPGLGEAPLYRGLLPGDVFPSGVAAVAACAADVDVQRPDDADAAEAWFAFAELSLVRCGVLEELDGGRLRVRKMPARNDLPRLVVDEVGEVLKGIGSTSLR